jgi:hypothetical protein
VAIYFYACQRYLILPINYSYLDHVCRKKINRPVTTFPTTRSSPTPRQTLAPPLVLPPPSLHELPPSIPHELPPSSFCALPPPPPGAPAGGCIPLHRAHHGHAPAAGSRRCSGPTPAAPWPASPRTTPPPPCSPRPQNIQVDPSSERRGARTPLLLRDSLALRGTTGGWPTSLCSFRRARLIFHRPGLLLPSPYREMQATPFVPVAVRPLSCIHAWS